MNDSIRSSLEGLVQDAAELFEARFAKDEYPGMRFGADAWDWTRRDAARRKKRVLFTDRNAERLPKDFEYLLKAFIVHKKQGPSKCYTVLLAVRCLVVTLRESLGGPTSVGLGRVTQGVLDEVPSVAQRYYESEGSRYNIGVALNELVSWCQAMGLVDGRFSVHGFPAQPDPRSLDPAAREKRKDRTPTREVLEALATVYRDATDPRHRFLVCAAGILIVAGFRVSELCTLPLNCLQEHKGKDDRPKFFIRFFQRKPGAKGRREETKRWLSPMGAELAERFIDELRELTRPYREAARWMEEHRDRLKIPDVSDDTEWLDANTVEKVLGFGNGVARRQALANHDPPILSRRADEVGVMAARVNSPFYNKSEIEEYLNGQVEGVVVHRTVAGEELLLSEALMIHPRHFFFPRKRSSKVVIESLRTGTLERFLKGDTNFSPLPEDLRTNPHAFRHWLSTVANRAGLSAFFCSVWFQRSNIQHQHYYLHDSVEVAELAKEKDRRGELIGGEVDAWDDMDEETREEERAFLSTAHRAATAICSLDFVNEECPLQKDCVMCSMGFQDLTDQTMRGNLKARRTALLQNRTRLARLRDDGIPIHERQIERADEVLEVIEGKLAAYREFEDNQTSELGK